jgi:hypothetical protein
VQPNDGSKSSSCIEVKDKNVVHRCCRRRRHRRDSVLLIIVVVVVISDFGRFGIFTITVATINNIIDIFFVVGLQQCLSKPSLSILFHHQQQQLQFQFQFQ